MNDPVRVRTAAIGLVSFAAAEERILLARRAAVNPGRSVEMAHRLGWRFAKPKPVWRRLQAGP
jgi:hypothetical protein